MGEAVQEQFQTWQPVKEKSSKKKIVVVITIIMVLLSLILLRADVKDNSIDEGSEAIKETFTNILNESLNDITHSNDNFQEISEMEEKLQNNREFVLSQLSDLKNTGKTEIYDLDVILNCNGLVYKPGLDVSYCDSSKFSHQGHKKYLVNVEHAIIRIMIDSFKIFMQEYTLDVLKEKKYEEKKSLERISAQGLDSLIFLRKAGKIWASIRNSFDESEGKPFINWSQDTNAKLLKLEKYGADLEVPTKKEIEGVEIKEGCIESFEETSKENQFQEVIKVSTKEKLLLIRNSYSDICENLEKYQKENALAMLKRTETEQNPILLIMDKMYLNWFVECNQDWVTIQGCESTFLKDFEKKFIAIINS